MNEPLIHIVEDDAPLREALVRLFRSAALASEAHSSVGDFLGRARPDRPGCLILDVRLPDMDGLELHGRLEELGIVLPTIVITGHGDIPMSVRAMKAGVVDFLVKPFRDQEMLDAVANALERDQARRAAASSSADLRARFETLSVREREVMALVTAGRMNKQAAWELGLSEITVKIHRRAAMQKMGARSLAELVRLAALLNAPP
ncbi:response regulator transcription factor [Roseomonas tokyonensis]|nr:response regulator transcription factor [Falsiroseomonas tokyonensis]